MVGGKWTHRAMLLGLVSLVAAGLVTAGSGAKPTSSHRGMAQSGATPPADIAYAKAQVAKYSGPENVVPAGTPFDARKLAGKTVWVVFVAGDTYAAAHAIHLELDKAFGAAHVKVHLCDGKGNPIGWNTCIRLAIVQRPGAIILLSIAPEPVSASIKAARAAKIPVFVDASYDSSAPFYALASGQTSFDFTLDARLTADWVIADSGGKAHALVIDTSDLGPLSTATTDNGYKYEFSKRCPGCSMTIGSVLIANWATGITPLVIAKLRRDPSINYVIAEFDAEARYAAPAIAQLGLNSKVKIATFNGSLDAVQAMASGSQPIGVDVGSDQGSLGWAEADQAMRVMAGYPPVRREHTGTRIFTASNVKGFKLDLKNFYADTWFGAKAVAAYQAAYRKLWKVG